MRNVIKDEELMIQCLESIIQAQTNLANDMLYKFEENRYTTRYYELQLCLIETYKRQLAITKEKLDILKTYKPMEEEMKRVQPELYGRLF